MMSHLAELIDGGVEELKRVAIGPASIVLRKIPFDGVTKHRGHSDLTVRSPWRRKVIDKVEILDVWVPSISLDDSQVL